MFWRKALHVLVISILLVGGLAAPSGAEASKKLAKSSLAKPTATTHTVCAIGCDFSSIQAAIDSVTVLAGDTLSLAGETFTESITIDKDLTIQGVGAESTIVQAAEAPGIATSRVITITDEISVTIQDITVRNGVVDDFGGGGIYVHFSVTFRLSNSNIISNTGGLYNRGDTSIFNCIFSDNGDLSTLAGAIYNPWGHTYIRNSSFINNTGSQGGAINSQSFGVVEIEGSTFSGNTARNGGALFNSYHAIVRNSTFINNIGIENGGGIYNNGNATLSNSTISGNQGSGILNKDTLTINHVTASGNIGNGISNVETLYLGNSILANSSGGYGDCINLGGTIYDLGHNLVENDTVGEYTCGFPNGGDPVLGPLQDNGGDTWTHALFPGSPAIDVIPPNECSEMTDQRGISRPQGSGCDIGAYEFIPVQINMKVNNPEPVPGETITFTIQITNPMGVTMTGGVISDTLPSGLNFLELITLEPPLSGTVGSMPPTLVSDLEIGAGGQVTVTLPVGVSDGLAAGTEITNIASVTCDQLPVTVSDSVTISIPKPEIYLPLIMRSPN